MRSLAVMGGLVLAVVLVVMGPAGLAWDQGTSHGVYGANTYRTYCRVCHGAKAQGDGPLAESLRFRPPDLTGLARRNDGEYPVEQVAKIIDGRDPVDGFGGPDMPVWGDAFKNSESGFDDEEVEKRIRSVVDHLARLQRE